MRERRKQECKRKREKDRKQQIATEKIKEKERKQKVINGGKNMVRQTEKSVLKQDNG